VSGVYFFRFHNGNTMFRGRVTLPKCII